MKKTILTIATIVAICSGLATIAFYPEQENDDEWLNGPVRIMGVTIGSYTDGLRRTSIVGATYWLSNNTSLSHNREKNTWIIRGYKEGSTIFTSQRASKEVRFHEDYKTLQVGDSLYIKGDIITRK